MKVIKKQSKPIKVNEYLYFLKTFFEEKKISVNKSNTNFK